MFAVDALLLTPTDVRLQVFALLQLFYNGFQRVSDFRRGTICFRIDISSPNYPCSPSCPHLLHCSCMCCRSLWPAGSGRRVSSSSRPRREHLSPGTACLHLRDSGNHLCRSYTCCKSRHTHTRSAYIRSTHTKTLHLQTCS